MKQVQKEKEVESIQEEEKKKGTAKTEMKKELVRRLQQTVFDKPESITVTACKSMRAYEWQATHTVRSSTEIKYCRVRGNINPTNFDFGDDPQALASTANLGISVSAAINNIVAPYVGRSADTQCELDIRAEIRRRQKLNYDGVYDYRYMVVYYYGESDDLLLTRYFAVPNAVFNAEAGKTRDGVYFAVTEIINSRENAQLNGDKP